MHDKENRCLGSINKNFVGFAREIFTDTSQYIVRLDARAVEDMLAITSSGTDARTDTQQLPEAGTTPRLLSQNERAVVLGCAVSIDFDYFSRHSGGGGGIGWFPFFGSWGSGENADTSDAPADGASQPPSDAGSASSSGGLFGSASGADQSSAPNDSPFLPDDDDGDANGGGIWGWFGDDE